MRITTKYFAINISTFPFDASIALLRKITGIANRNSPKIANIIWVLIINIIARITPTDKTKDKNDKNSDFPLIKSPNCSQIILKTNIKIDKLHDI